MTIQQKIRMTVEDYLVWAEGQPGRYELVDGEPMRMAAERARTAEARVAAAGQRMVLAMGVRAWVRFAMPPSPSSRRTERLPGRYRSTIRPAW